MSDNEEIINPNDEIERTVSSIGWGYIKERFLKRFKELDKVTDIDTSQSAEHVKIEVMKRQELIKGIEAEVDSVLLQVEDTKRKKIDYS